MNASERTALQQPMRVIVARSARRRGRGWLVGSLVLLLLLAAPSPAAAWWGWLEKLSGPGGFRGRLYDFRVLCFGDRLHDQVAAAEAAEAGGDRSAAEEKWREAAEAFAAALGVPLDRTVSYQEFVRRSVIVATATNSSGVLWSVCPADTVRRVGLDVAFDDWRADGDPQYAAGHPIELRTLMGSMSWRLVRSADWDVVDAGASAGIYWFSSRGFDSFRGLILQPGRLSFHAPSSWHGRPLNDWRRWAALPTFTVGITIFPAGFDSDAFAGVGDRAVRIPAEAVLTRSIFINFEPLLRMKRR